MAAIHLTTLLWKVQAKIAEKRLAAVSSIKEEVRPKGAMAA